MKRKVGGNDLEEVPRDKRLCSFKNNTPTKKNGKDRSKKVKDKTGSAQSVTSNFINSYVSFIKNRNQNDTLDMSPEWSQPCSIEINDLNALKNEGGVSETVIGSSDLKKRKKTNHHGSSNFKNVMHYDSLLEKDRGVDVIEISSSELSSSMKTPISSEKKSLNENSGGSKNVNGTNYGKKRRKKKHQDSNSENVIQNDTILEKERSNKAIEINSSELSLSEKTSNSLENKSLTVSEPPQFFFNETSYFKKRRKKNFHNSSRLENVIQNDSSLENNGSSEVTGINSSELSSPGNRKSFSLENKTIKGKCGGSETLNKTSYLKKRKKTKRHHGSSRLGNVIHYDSSLKNNGSMEVIEIRSSELSSSLNGTPISSENSISSISPQSASKKSQVHKISVDENINSELFMADNKPNPESSFPSSKSDGKRKKKCKHAIQNESKISQGETNDILCVSERQSTLSETNGILKRNISVCGISPILSPCVTNKMCIENVGTEQNETNIHLSGSSNTELFASRPKISLLSNRANSLQEAINSGCPMFTLKNKKKQRETSRNDLFHPDHELCPSSQSPLCKRKMKHKNRNTNASHNSWEKAFNTDTHSSETGPPLMSVETSKKKGATSESFVIKPKNNNLLQQTDNVTIHNESEKSSPSVLLSSSCKEIEEHLNVNINALNMDSDDESIRDISSSKETSFAVDLLALYTKKIGNRKEECDKMWNDAVVADSGRSYSSEDYRGVEVNISHDIPTLHLLDGSACGVPKKEEREQLVAMGMKKTPFNKAEDAIIMKNWNELCEDNGFLPSALLEYVTKRVGGYKKSKRRIVQYLGKGLPDRALYQIYQRFVLLSCSKKGLFTDEEDYLILKTVNSGVKEKYALLSTMLKRSRNTIYKRYQTLLAYPRDMIGECDRVKNKWDKDLASSVVKSLMTISGASSIEDFRDTIISLDLWRKVEKDINILNRKLHHFWIYRLHIQLFAKSPVCVKQVQKKIVEWLHQKNYPSETDIQWSESQRLVSGSTASFMWLQFRTVKYSFRFKAYKGLREFIKAVYPQRNIFDLKSRYLTRYKVNNDFSLSEIEDEAFFP